MPSYDAGRFDPPAPVVAVELRHPGGEGSVADVPMLIDSGADATLIPGRAVADLGIAGTGERFRQMAFDGAISEAEAYRVDLVCFGRRFMGRYLLVDSEVGVLGRDVLNHVRLVLDGPASTWDRWPQTKGP